MSFSSYEIALFIHIASAIHLVGGTVVSPLVVRRVREAATRAEIVMWTSLFQRVNRFHPASALVLLGSGIFLGASGWWREGWFHVSLFAWVVSSVLAAAVLKPSAMRIVTAASSDVSAAIDAELDALRDARAMRIAERVMLGSDFAILWVMIAKPSLVASALIVIAAAAVFVAPALLVRTAAARIGAAEPRSAG